MKSNMCPHCETALTKEELSAEKCPLCKGLICISAKDVMPDRQLVSEEGAIDAPSRTGQRLIYQFLTYLLIGGAGIPAVIAILRGSDVGGGTAMLSIGAFALGAVGATMTGIGFLFNRFFWKPATTFQDNSNSLRA